MHQICPPLCLKNKIILFDIKNWYNTVLINLFDMIITTKWMHVLEWFILKRNQFLARL